MVLAQTNAVAVPVRASPAMNTAAKQPVPNPGEAMAFVDLAAQYRRLEPRIRARIDRVLAHGRFIHGPEIQELEEALANHAGVRHAVSCASGTDALLMALMAQEVGPGDAVFTTPFTFIATAEPIALLGATPVFADIDPRTFNLDPVALETVVQRTVQGGGLTPRGVIAVDLFGLPADYDAIGAIARRNGLFLVEDAAQSFGASYRGRHAGSLASLAAFSFFPAKPLGCYGDGGALLTNDDELAARLRSIRVHGQGGDKYDNVRIGLNARLDTLQAAILLAKLESFPAEHATRQGIAQRYTQGLHELVQTPYVPQGYTSAWAQYSILSERRAEIQQALRAHSIPSAVYYRKALHLQPAFASLGLGEGAFPVAEATARRILSLPMHPYLEPPQQERVVAAIESALRS